MKKTAVIAHLFLFTLGALSLLGCEESVDPVLGTDQRFTLFGFLNPRADTQAVRVFSVDEILEVTGNDPLDARFTSRSIATGEEITWRDSIVTFLDDSRGHVYYAEFRPAHDAVYRVNIESPDEVVTDVEVRTPPQVSPALTDVQSANRNVIVRVDWSGAPQILESEIVYHVETEGIIDTVLVDRTVRLKSGEIKRRESGTWVIEFRPSRDIGQLYTFLNLRPGIDKLFLKHVVVRAFVANAAWDPPTGTFNPDLLVQPGTFSNVSKGFGFVGAGYYESFLFEPGDDVREDAGFNLK